MDTIYLSWNCNVLMITNILKYRPSLTGYQKTLKTNLVHIWFVNVYSTFQLAIYIKCTWRPCTSGQPTPVSLSGDGDPSVAIIAGVGQKDLALWALFTCYLCTCFSTSFHEACSLLKHELMNVSDLGLVSFFSSKFLLLSNWSYYSLVFLTLSVSLCLQLNYLLLSLSIYLSIYLGLLTC